jgi:hypothetical protein
MAIRDGEEQSQLGQCVKPPLQWVRNIRHIFRQCADGRLNAPGLAARTVSAGAKEDIHHRR